MYLLFLKTKNMKQIFCIAILLLGMAAECEAQTWTKLGIDTNKLFNGYVYALCADDSNNIYVAGMLQDTGWAGYDTYHVAKWDGNAWSIVGTDSNSLLANDGIRTLCIGKQNHYLYAAGYFTNGALPYTGTFYVAQWDGSRWSELGTSSNALNANGCINKICTDDSGNVYAAGNFRNDSGYEYVAKWNGTKWQELGYLHANSYINALCVDDSLNVYAAGNFTDSTSRVFVAKWSNALNKWIHLPVVIDTVGIIGEVITAIVLDTLNQIYIGFEFYDAYGNDCNVYKYMDNNWNKLGTLNRKSSTNVLCIDKQNNLYATECLPNNIHIYNVYLWNEISATWTVVGDSNNSLVFNGVIGAMCLDNNNNIYAAGSLVDSITNQNYVVKYRNNTKVEPLNRGNETINVYPNPVQDELFINTKTIGDEIAYYLYDLSGKILMRGKLLGNDTTIGMQDLPIGVYLLKVNDETFRIVKA